MASFTTVFLLMRSSSAMNSSGRNPILTSNSSKLLLPPSLLLLLISYVLSTILTSASGTPIHHSVTITISLGTVLQVDEPQSHTVLYIQSLLYHLSQDVHPVCCSSLLNKPLLFFPEVTFYSSPGPCVQTPLQQFQYLAE